MYGDNKFCPTTIIHVMEKPSEKANVDGGQVIETKALLFGLAGYKVTARERLTHRDCEKCKLDCPLSGMQRRR